MATLELPVRSDLPSYEFQIDLEERIYTIRIQWNDRKERWVMNILTSEGVPVLMGITLLTNVGLIDQYLNISSEMPPGRFFCIDETGAGKNPGINDLGNDVKLFYLTSDEVTIGL